MVLLCILGWSQVHDPPDSASQVLGLQVYATAVIELASELLTQLRVYLKSVELKTACGNAHVGSGQLLYYLSDIQLHFRYCGELGRIALDVGNPTERARTFLRRGFLGNS